MIDLRNEDCMKTLATIPDKSIDLVVTDPPYKLGSTVGGGMFGSNHRTFYKEIEGMSEGISPETLDELMRVMKVPNLYIWNNWNGIVEILSYFSDKNVYTNLLSWHKTNPPPLCSGKYLSDTEYCLFVKGKGVKIYGGYEDHKTYWIESLNTKDKKLYNHPTIKPVGMIERMIRNSSQPGDVVLDPFMGTGTTGVACVNLGRSFIGCEIDPTHFQTAGKRINHKPVDSGYF